jgi:hypothetical protein
VHENQYALSASFLDGWRSWMQANCVRLLTSKQVCTTFTRHGPVHLLGIDIMGLIDLVEGMYLSYWQGLFRIRYLYLALDCDTRIVEAAMHNVDGKIFQLVDLLLRLGLTWNENLSTLEYQWHIRVGLTNPRKGNKSVVYISTYRSKTRHALATINLAAIKTIIERAKRSSHF